jgi:glycosyltransferase involved in cell wall biosynthesis
MNKNKNYTVSVLIPAFNEEKYIIKTLEAILKQDYINYEVIVIDNASTDATVEVVKNFLSANTEAANKIQLLQESKQGTNHARECGRKKACGDIIAQLDADCIPSPHWISEGVRLLKHKNVVAATGPYDYFDSGLFRRITTLFGQIIFYPLIDTFSQLFRRGGIIIGGNSFIDAAVLDKAGGYNVELTFYGDDIDIAKRIFVFGRILYSNTLILRSSSRRFKALGFQQVQKKYRKAFIEMIFFKGIKINQSIEMVHPR